MPFVGRDVFLKVVDHVGALDPETGASSEFGFVLLDNVRLPARLPKRTCCSAKQFFEHEKIPVGGAVGLEHFSLSDGSHYLAAAVPRVPVPVHQYVVSLLRIGNQVLRVLQCHLLGADDHAAFPNCRRFDPSALAVHASGHDNPHGGDVHPANTRRASSRAGQGVGAHTRTSNALESRACPLGCPCPRV